MAEELDIRSLWNKSKAKEDPKSLHINMMERKGTKTTLYWVKFILWIEFFISIVGLPLALIYYPPNLNTFGFKVFYVAITIVYLFYYQFLIRQIRNFSYDGNVVDSLRKVYGYLRFYLLHYKVVIWLSLTVGFVIGIIQGIEDEGGLPEDAGLKFWIIIVGVSLVAIGIMGGILTLCIHLIYGRKIKRLKRTVKDLESDG